MIHFKSHNGFSFIEMMIALTLLSIFGTSLFLVQTNILSKLSKTHQSIVRMFELDKQLFTFNQDIQFNLQQKKPIDKITLHHEEKNTDDIVDIKLKTIDASSTLFKDFGKNVRMIQASISNENKSDLWWSFIYIPPESKAEKPTLKETT